MEFGINFNGDISFEEIIKGVRLAEQFNYTHIWVGESTHFKHPFPVISAIAHNTRSVVVGAGIVSYFFNRSHHIRAAFETLVETYGPRFAIALAPGDVNSLRSSGIDYRHPLKRLKQTIGHLKESAALTDVPIYAGASGPRMIEEGSNSADGVLLNYGRPEYVKWAFGHLKKKRYVGVYAPAFLAPDEKNEKTALIAAAFVAAGSNRSFQEDFGIEDEVMEIRQILGRKRYADLQAKKRFLFDGFLMYGEGPDLLERFDEFERMGVDQVILGSPFTYNLKAVEIIGRSL